MTPAAAHIRHKTGTDTLHLYRDNSLRGARAPLGGEAGGR
jgi:hypothetical protein